MSEAFIVEWFVAEQQSIEMLMKAPEARKLSRNMMYVHTLLSEFYESVSVSNDFSQRTGLVISSSHGELGLTTEFFRSIACSNLARPLLFQHSLHNATLGNASLFFPIEGPALTLSNGYFSGENALETADLLIRSNQCDLAFAIGVDTEVEAIKPIRDLMVPSQLNRGEGAALMVFAGEDFLKKIPSLVAKAKLSAVDYHYKKKVLDLEHFKAMGSFYDSDAIARICRSLDQGLKSSCFLKPDGTSSTLSFEIL